MQFKITSLFVAASFAIGALAGENCKCQAANGQGPQYNDATAYCCRGQGGTDFGTVRTCFLPAGTYPGANSQCTARGSNCIDSGAKAETSCSEKAGRDSRHGKESEEWTSTGQGRRALSRKAIAATFVALCVCTDAQEIPVNVPSLPTAKIVPR
ncbi:hypothetical protein BKA70DRAFT_1237012 [Coprinopsis sp. MPI-PUGE-AT-0042]|nr:hypothetical protein BKA70DRAFT_1237012 [Coprinopsis sp. MPI-PUGE-AT-0042]